MMTFVNKVRFYFGNIGTQSLIVLKRAYIFTG